MKKVCLFISFLILRSAFCCGQVKTVEVPEESVSADTLAASSVMEYAVRSITPVRTLSGETLERLSAQTPADALRYFSGIQIKDYGGIGGLKTVNVRSLGAQHVGIFYDGIKINNAQNGQVDLGRYSMDNMERISVYNAQKSETLQSAADYASASAVYFKTRRPVFDGRDWNLKARMKYGSYRSLNPSMRYERKLGKASLSAEAMYLKTKGDYLFTIKNGLEDTTARRHNSDVTAARAELTMHAPLLKGEMQAHAYWYSSERGLPGPVVRRLSDQYASTDRQWDDNAFVQASYRKDFAKAALLLNAKTAYDALEYLSDPETNSAAVFTHNHYRQMDVYGSAAIALYPWQWLSANFAFDERWSDLNCDVSGFHYVQRFDTKAAAAATISLGAFTAQTSLLYTCIQDVTRGMAGPLTRLTPTVVLGWRKGALATRAFYKSVFRAPTLNDLYYTLVGNAQLRPEYTRQWDLGADWKLAEGKAFASTLSMDIYYNRIKDKIVAMPVRSQFRWSMMNFGEVEGCGLNASLSSCAMLGSGSISSVLSYACESARDITSPEDLWYGGQIPYTPKHSGSFILNFQQHGWNLSASALYTGVRYRTSDNSEESRMEPWTTIDASISHDFSLMGTAMELALDMNNILNRQYEVVTRYPMPGISFNCKLTIKI